MGTPADNSFDLRVDIQAYSDQELKALRGRLVEEELAVSRHRRILYGQLDILTAEAVRRLRDKRQAGQSLFGNGDDPRE